MRTATMMTAVLAAVPGAALAQLPDFHTPYGTLSFERRGDRYVGRYPHQEGRIEGRLSGRTFEGRWHQRDGDGRITISFTADFAAFTARYDHDDGNWATDWSGVRREAIRRHAYRTLWGTLRCEAEGRQMECRYPWFNGRLLGDLQGTRFRGIWLQSNGGVGNIELDFAPDHSSIAGRYNDWLNHPERWFAWRGDAAPAEE